MSLLAARLQPEPPSDPDLENSILNGLWPTNTRHNDEFDAGPFFYYYAKQCSHAQHHQGKHVLLRTHQHIVDITGLLHTSAHLPRDTLRVQLQRLFPQSTLSQNPEVLDNTLDVVARIYLMVNIAKGQSKYAISGQRYVQWGSDSLRDSISAEFNDPPKMDHSGVKLEPGFTTCNMAQRHDKTV
jgi:hypothetical protein